jgi:hypothetical protein
MKVILKVIILAAVSCALTTFNSAQDHPTATQSGERAGDNEPGIETKFDRIKNETNVGLRLLLILSTETDKLLISVDGTYATQAPTQHPGDVVFIISVMNKTGYKYPDLMALNITADGKHLSPVSLANLDKRTVEGDYYETLGLRMDYDVFMQLATAQEADLQFSQTSIALKNKHLAKLRELANRLHL